jgi:hypothetical protein
MRAPCGVFYSLDEGAKDDAYAQATVAHKEGKLDGSLVEVREAVKQVLLDAGSECPLCQA